jgi:50S ribosomal protein L16 3-hydroxylase
MLQFAAEALGRIRWSRADVVDFVGRYLSAPKPQVVFHPTSTLGPRVRLDARTQLLYFGERFFMNGESLRVRQPRLLRELADRRESDRARLAPLRALIAEWRQAGYVHYV